MKKLLIFCLLFTSMINAESATSLSNQSKLQIATKATQGAIAGVAATALGWAVYTYLHPIKPCFNSAQTKNWALLGLAVSTVCGLAAGLWKYENTPEYQYSYVENEITHLDEDNLIKMLGTTESGQWITTIKKQFCRSRFPLVRGFTYFDSLYMRVLSCQKAVVQVLASDRSDFREECIKLQVILNHYKNLIADILYRISSEPDYEKQLSYSAMPWGNGCVYENAPLSWGHQFSTFSTPYVQYYPVAVPAGCCTQTYPKPIPTPMSTPPIEPQIPQVPSQPLPIQPQASQIQAETPFFDPFWS